MALKTEFAFNLPRGLLDADGVVHSRGVMRMATARDEIEPLRDPRISDSEDPLLTLIILSRVVTELGDLASVSTKEIESLFALDLAYLQDLYSVVNFGSESEIAAFLEDSLEVAAEAVETESTKEELSQPKGRSRGGAVIEEVPK